jgi:hypothetical protein
MKKFRRREERGADYNGRVKQSTIVGEDQQA